MNLPFPREGRCLTDEEIAAYLDHRAEESDRLERHLAGCEDCLDLLLGVRKAEEPAVAVPERLTARIVAMGPSRRNPSIRRFLERRRTHPLLALAAAAAVILVGIVAVLSLTERLMPSARKREEAVRTDERPGETKEDVAEKFHEPRRSGGETDGPRKNAIAEAGPAIIDAVAGRIACGDRELKVGDPIRATDTLRTRFGESARVEVLGTTLWVHHETDFGLDNNGAVRLDRGRLFLRGDRGWFAETPSGTVHATGADVSLEVADGATAVTVKSGAALFRNSFGARRIEKGLALRCSPGEAPPFPSRVADLNGALAWTAQVERATRSPKEAGLILYPAARRTSLVVTAPHMPVESQTARFATNLAERRKASLVIANGYKRIRRIEVNVPGDTGESRAAFEAYRRLVTEAADRSPLGLLVEIHGYGGEGDPSVIEIATTGFTTEELQQCKQTYAKLLQKHRPKVEAALVFEATDPTYEYGGRKIRYKYGVGSMATRGIFQKEIAARGWKVELPYACRYEAHEKYEAILSDLIAEALR